MLARPRNPLTPKQLELALRYLPALHQLANRMVRRLPKSVDVQDLIQWGWFGLSEAAQTFRPHHQNVAFWNFAHRRVRGAIIDGLRGFDWVPRLSRLRDEQITGMGSLDYIVGRDESGDAVFLRETLARPDPDLQEADLRDWVERILSAAPDARSREILRLYYMEGWTMKRIGQRFGISESRTSQLHADAIAVLRSRVKADGAVRVVDYVEQLETPSDPTAQQNRRGPKATVFVTCDQLPDRVMTLDEAAFESDRSVATIRQALKHGRAIGPRRLRFRRIEKCLSVENAVCDKVAA